MSAARDNPYLQHKPPHQRGIGLAIGNGATGGIAKEPLYGFLARNVTSQQVTKAMVRPLLIKKSNREHWGGDLWCKQEHDLNAFTKQPHSAQYKKILEGRKKLPVFAQMQEFYKMVSGGIALSSLLELGNFTVAVFGIPQATCWGIVLLFSKFLPCSDIVFCVQFESE